MYYTQYLHTRYEIPNDVCINEFPVAIELNPEFKLVGAIDKIYKQNGKWIIAELKTANTPKSMIYAPYQDYVRQLQTYHQMLENSGVLFENAELQLHILCKEVKRFPVYPEELERTKAKGHWDAYCKEYCEEIETFPTDWCEKRINPVERKFRVKPNNAEEPIKRCALLVKALTEGYIPPVDWKTQNIFTCKKCSFLELCTASMPAEIRQKITKKRS